jgi:hypothetical protein
LEHIWSDRLLPGEQVFKGRNLGTIGMTTLDRLLQLLRVTKQNDIFRSLGDGQHIRQRHLPASSTSLRRGFRRSAHPKLPEMTRPTPSTI